MDKQRQVYTLFSYHSSEKEIRLLSPKTFLVTLLENISFDNSKTVKTTALVIELSKTVLQNRLAVRRNNCCSRVHLCHIADILFWIKLDRYKSMFKNCSWMMPDNSTIRPKSVGISVPMMVMEILAATSPWPCNNNILTGFH